jgi:PAS domain S-box-containing protein
MGSASIARSTALRGAFEDAGVGLALVGHDRRWLHANAALERLIGPIAPGTPCPLLDEAACGADYERELAGPDGEPLWLLVTVASTPSHLVLSAHDVTARKLAEQALGESTARYRALVEHLPMAIVSWGLDPSEGATYISPQIEAILGCPVDDWYSRHGLFEDILHPDDRDAVLERLFTSLANGDDVRCEFRMQSGDGRWVTMRMEAVAITDDQGWPLYLQGYLQDVSEHRRLEQQLRIAQKLESVGQLAAGIAHEINTPIQFAGDSIGFIEDATGDLLALIAALDALEAGGGAPELRARAEQARELADVDYVRERVPGAFERARDGLRRVGEIVRAMRDFADPDSGEHAPVDVNEAVRNTLVVTHSQYKLVADVETELGDIPPVPASGSEIKQVLINLIVNAAHAIADAGTDQRGTIRVRTWRAGDEVAIAVSDTGCGIPVADHERVFDPFFTTKEVGRGTGQGLAISRSIVHDRHGGSIALDSEVGRGTTIEVRLPIG